MNRFLIIVAVVCIPAFTHPIQACECREYDTPVCAQFWRSDAVFVGRVIDVKPLRPKPDNVYEYLMVRFIVEERFRGVSGATFNVGTATTMCDTKFKKGKSYLVYASLDVKTNQYFTGMCTGTGLTIGRDDSLNELRTLARRQASESISGSITRNRYQGVAGVKIEVLSNEQTYQQITTRNGTFSVSLPGPGFFRVRVTVPYAVKLVDHSDEDVTVRSTETGLLSIFEYDVTLEKSQCNYMALDLFGTDPRATATVSGNVFSAAAQPIDRSMVSLVNLLDTAPNYIEQLEKDGSFRFERVAPGEYYLVLNARNGFDSPYAPTYYPATEDQRQAKRIQVAEGATIENLELRVGSRLSERTVMGTVKWKSGRKPESAHISLYSGDKYVRYILVDEDGKFSFTLYGDFAYSIEATDYTDEIEGRSQRIKLTPQNLTGLRLIIERVKP